MNDNRSDFFKTTARLPVAEPLRLDADERDEESCPAFGYLRGDHDRAVMVEFRLKNGESEFHSYNCLTSFRYNPSAGILLRFTADLVTLVLIRGSNLDLNVGDRKINLTNRGLQRHRITFIREMDEAELRRAGNKQVTIDKIEIATFEDSESLTEWLAQNAPAFVRK
jgi:hypothetical protein